MRLLILPVSLIFTLLLFVPACAPNGELNFASSIDPNSIAPTPTPAVTTPEQRESCKSPDKSGWEIESLKGKVKILKDEGIEYGYGDKKKELKRIVSFDRFGNFIKADNRGDYSVTDYTKLRRPTYIFDDNCRVLERRGADGESKITHTTYRYSSSGTLIEEATFDLQNQLLWKSVSELDANDRPKEKKKTIQVHPEHFNPKRYDVYRETRSLFRYDDTGNLIGQVDYKYDGTLYATYLRVYDSANRLIRLTRLDHKERPINLSIYKFDETGKLSEKLEYNSATYIGTDELAPAKLDSGFGFFQDGTRIVYEYDKTDNWIKKNEFDLNAGGKLSSTTFRTLTYF